MPRKKTDDSFGETRATSYYARALLRDSTIELVKGVLSKEDEVAICDDSGDIIAYVVSPEWMDRARETPEFIAELTAQARSAEHASPTAEVLTRLRQGRTTVRVTQGRRGASSPPKAR